MLQISLEEAEKDLARLVEAVRSGEEVVITTDCGPVAKLIPVNLPPARPLFGFAKGTILHMADDFDAPLEDFKDYM